MNDFEKASLYRLQINALKESIDAAEDRNFVENEISTLRRKIIELGRESNSTEVGRRQTPNRQTSKATTVVFGNLANYLEEPDMRTFLPKKLPVKMIKSGRTLKAEVVFRSPDAAAKAVNKFNGRKLDDRSMNVYVKR